MVSKTVGISKVGIGLATEVGNHISTRSDEHNGAEARSVLQRKKEKSGDDTEANLGPKGLGSMEGVRVGDIVVHIGAHQEKVASKMVQEEESAPNARTLPDEEGCEEEVEHNIHKPIPKGDFYEVTTILSTESPRGNEYREEKSGDSPPSSGVVARPISPERIPIEVKC
ncbi:hypothetical protein TSUD_193330 [Trifolium subterraneum]|uniref:Uncharacterized protein n=1 Tax=Trifolium subterraneum TaxID=3900 RepID=A0A2Z6MRZ8_TRISU|nr:hypothetical protein TSUD_193330 [Trifolium subterraneum]